MKPDLRIITGGRTVAHISKCEGCTVIEPMRFLWPSEARRIAQKQRQLASPVDAVGRGAKVPLRPATPNHPEPPEAA